LTGVFELSDALCCRAVELAEEAEKKGIALKLLGGIGIALLCKKAIERNPVLKRVYQDIDFAAHSRQRELIEEYLTSYNFQPAKEFNFLAGHRRLLFFHPLERIKIDIFLNKFSMCHVIDLSASLKNAQLTLDEGDLLLTKLQVVELNQRDVKDLVALLLTASIFKEPEQELQLRTTTRTRLSSCFGRDWGLWKTSKLTLNRILKEPLMKQLNEEDASSASEALRQIDQLLEKAPKTIRWKMRALLGTRVRWYELPEEP